MKSVYLFAILYFLPGVLVAQQKISLEQLRSRIIEQMNIIDGEYSIAFRTLSDSTEEILINEHSIFHAASTMKTAVMIEAFRQHYEGIINLEDSVTVKNEFKSIVDGSRYEMDLNRDSGESLYESLGKNQSIRKLVYEMITVSSNLATNLLIDIIGAENVQKTIDKLGVRDMKVLRGVEDIKAFDQGLNNVTTAYDLMILFQSIASGTAVSEKASDEMTSILLDQKFNEMIPAGLPSDAACAHKTGSISGIQHDSGFIILPDGRRYILVILCSNLQDNSQAIAAGAKVSLMIYDYLNKKL